MTKTAETNGAKRLARLAAVQALYELGYEQQAPAEVAQAFVDSGFEALQEENKTALSPEAAVPETGLFTRIVEGTVANQAEIDGVIEGALATHLSGERLERLLRAILRAAVFELWHHAEVPKGVIINDYVDVTRAFFNQREPGLVNAVLDKLASQLRA